MGDVRNLCSINRCCVRLRRLYFGLRKRKRKSYFYCIITKSIAGIVWKTIHRRYRTEKGYQMSLFTRGRVSCHVWVAYFLHVHIHLNVIRVWDNVPSGYVGCVAMRPPTSLAHKSGREQHRRAAKQNPAVVNVFVWVLQGIHCFREQHVCTQMRSWHSRMHTSFWCRSLGPPSKPSLGNLVA